MASCSLCIPHDTAETRNIELSQALEIRLPYYREIVDYLPSPSARSNYSPYHLFSLKKNITPFISSIDKTYDIGFSTRENGESMVVILDIYKGGERVILNKNILQLIQSNLNQYLDLYPNCLVYDSSYEEYPIEWLKKVLPRIDCGVYQSGAIFIDLDGAANYNTQWQMYYDKISNTLAKW